MVDKSAKIETSDRLNRNLALLQAGAKITIDIATPAGQKSKFVTTFVGYLPKQYVLIQFPDSGKLGNFSQYFTQGTALTVRGLIEGHEGAVVAFISSIKQTLHIPSRLIVLTFPQSVSLQNLRTSIRIDTDIASKVKMDNEYWQSSITDISVTGCQLLVSNGEKLLLSKEKQIEITIDDYEGLNNINLSADICTMKQLGNGVSLGLRFVDKSKDSVTKLIHHAVTLEG